MRFHRNWVWLCLWILGIVSPGSSQQARQLEQKGDGSGARQMLSRAAQGRAAKAEDLWAYAEFLDRHRDPACREAYEKVLAALEPTNDRAKQAEVARRLVELDLIANDRAAAERHAEAFKRYSGQSLSIPAAKPKGEPLATVEVPGPLRSFARMAALSPDLAVDDLLPALARNVVTNGYQASSSSEALDQTEYLKLVVRYLSQARELAKLTGDNKHLRVETCESSQTGDLLKVLGYRMRGGCGSEVVLETVNATRAFLTIDSGFPLAELEVALRTNRPFDYNYSPTRVPVLYGPDYWLSAKEKEKGDFIDAFLSDPSLCRMYLGMSKLDPETASALKTQMSATRIRAYAHVLDFFGGMLQVRNGKAIVPGGARAEKAWEGLVGASPQNGPAFAERLLSRDDGWMASYFDSLMRIQGPVLDYLTDADRMKRFYTAIRGRITSPGPARPVFRSNTELMLLTTRLRLEPNGKPHIPGGMEVWKNLFVKHPHGKYDGKLTKAASGWKEPDDVVEALFALCRKAVENEPLKIFMAMSDINRLRAKPLEPATVDRLAREFRLFAAQYPIFAEVPSLSDKTIIEYMDTAVAISQIRDPGMRADTAGMAESLVALWQILCRLEALPPARADSTLSGLLAGFGKMKGNRELFDAGRSGVKLLLAETGNAGASPQDRLLDLMAGGTGGEDTESHTRAVQELNRVLDSQRLVSLKTLFDLADHLDAVAKGEKLNSQLVSRLAARISEIQLPRAALTGMEKNALSFGYWTERHIDAQRKLNLRAATDKASGSPEKLAEVRGQLTPFLRDTLVGLNYAYYAPPGAQILYTNPLFVRSHDFIGLQGTNQTWKNTEVQGTGWPSSAGGRLVGSLAGLPYALAEAEQNFLVPSREQALIWGDLVPQMILSAKVPRWWSVQPSQLHWVGLHMRFGETLLADAVLDGGKRQKLADVLEQLAPPARAGRVIQLLESGDLQAALDNVTPSEQFLLAAQILRSGNTEGVISSEIRRMAQESPAVHSYAAVSKAFGTPKPTLANSYRPELLNLRTFPTLMGYSSRIMAESWESNLLFYAALADEVHLKPSQLNLLIPEWTQKTVERIFATHLEDWPALLRSLRLVGEDVRQKSRKQFAQTQAGSLE